MPLTLTLLEVGRRIGVSEKTARKVVQGWPYIVVSARKRFHVETLEAYLRRESRIPVRMTV